MTPVSPPTVKMNRKPSTNSIGTRSCGLPSHRVAIQAKTWMPIGTAMAVLAAAKKDSDSRGSPVVYMWWTHRPKLRKPIATAAITTQV